MKGALALVAVAALLAAGCSDGDGDETGTETIDSSDQPAATNEAAELPDPCELFSAEDMQSFLESRSETVETVTSRLIMGDEVCSFTITLTTAGTSATIEVGSRDDYDYLRNSADVNGDETAELDGVGDEAVIINGLDGPASVILVGDRMLSVAIGYNLALDLQIPEGDNELLTDLTLDVHARLSSADL